MNKSAELNIIDYALITTMNKGEQYRREENISYALKAYVFQNNPSGITSNKDARRYICDLSLDDIKKELLKNIVKKDAYSTRQGYAKMLSTNKTFEQKLSQSELELLLVKTISEMPMEAVDYILETYPRVVDSMINSFVSSRYYDDSFGMSNIDNVDSLASINLLKKIDEYYYGKKYSEYYGQVQK